MSYWPGNQCQVRLWKVWAAYSLKRRTDSAERFFTFRCSTTRRLVQWEQPLPSSLERSQANRYAKICVTLKKSWKRVRSLRSMASLQDGVARKSAPRQPRAQNIEGM